MPEVTDMGGVPVQGNVPRILQPWGNVQGLGGMSMFRPVISKPFSSDFTQVNTFASVVDKSDRLVASFVRISGGTAGAVRIMTQPVLGAPYTAEFIGGMSGVSATTNFNLVGIARYDGTKIEALGVGHDSGVPKVRLDTYATAGTAATNITNSVVTNPGPGVNALRVVDDGTNFACYFSHNGKDWALLNSRARGTFLTATTIGLYFFAGGTTDTAIASIYHWRQYGGLPQDIN